MSPGTHHDSLLDVPQGAHVCWVIDDDLSYRRSASHFLRAAAARGEKPVVFGPDGSDARDELSALAEIAVDPRVAFLSGGPLDRAAMFAMFREQTERARDEGFRGLALVADMDWLLPMAPSMHDVTGFELLLGRRVNELDATIVCAYRRASFDTDSLIGVGCVHPIVIGAAAAAPFRIAASGTDAWTLEGEIDMTVSKTFAAALDAALTETGDIDAGSLAFIDVAGMRALAEAAQRRIDPVRVVHAPRLFRRSWELAGFGADTSAVQFVG